MEFVVSGESQERAAALDFNADADASLGLPYMTSAQKGEGDQEIHQICGQIT